MKYKDMTDGQLKEELKYLKKRYYAPESRKFNGKQTSFAFREYGEKIFEIKRILLERHPIPILSHQQEEYIRRVEKLYKKKL